MNERKFSGFYLLKGIAIMCVIMIHVISFYPGDYNSFDAKEGPFFILRYIFNLGVPIFFIISGFLLSHSLQNNKLTNDLFNKKLFRILKPLIFFALFYMLFPDMKSILDHGLLRTYYWKIYNYFVDPSFFLSTFGTGHLWYLVSTIYALFIIKVLINRNMMWLLTILMISFIILSPTAHKHFHPFQGEIVNFNPRAGIMTALPYMVAGMLLEKKIKITLIATTVCLLIFTIMFYIEIFIFTMAMVQELITFFVSLFITSLFLLVNVDRKNIFSKIGERSLGIYGIHIVFLIIFNDICISTDQTLWFSVVPIITLILSYLSVYILEKNTLTYELVK